MSTLQKQYRPQDLNEFYGNTALVESLGLILEREEDIPSAFLFTGPPGMGKTTLARVIKEMLKVSDSDFYEYNTGNLRGIDTIRKIGEDMIYMPSDSKWKIYFLDECHRQTVDALNALLKYLEDPPSHVMFILASAEFETIKSEKLRGAIRRRCHEYEVKPFNRGEMLELLQDILAAEEIEDYPKEVLDEIIKRSKGSAGVALKMLDQVIDITDNDVAIQTLDTIVIGERQIIEICRTFMQSDISYDTRWKKIKSILNGFSGDPEDARRGILGYFDKVILNDKTSIQKAFKVMSVSSIFVDSFVWSGRPGLTMACLLATKALDDDVAF